MVFDFVDIHWQTSPNKTVCVIETCGFPPSFLSRMCGLVIETAPLLHSTFCWYFLFRDIYSDSRLNFCLSILSYYWWTKKDQERPYAKFRSAALQICVDSIPIMLVTPVVACKLHSSRNGTGWYSVKPAWLTHRLVFYDGWDILKRWSHRIFVGRLHVWEIFWDHVHPCHVPI